MVSPMLEGADRAIVWCSTDKGQWSTQIKRNDHVVVTRHKNQKEAFEFVGLQGGSPDPNFLADQYTVAVSG